MLKINSRTENWNVQIMSWLILLFNIFAYSGGDFMAVYEQIRNLREDNDLKQKDLAQYLHCTQVSYSYYEIGKRDIPTATLIKLASYYKCSVDYLLNLTDVRRPYPVKSDKPLQP